MSKYFSADYVFPISSPPIKNGVIEVDDTGTIQNVFSEEVFSLRTPNFPLQTFNGIICPGFINAHCHLELSHMKGKMAERSGLPNFISDIIKKRNASEEEINNAIVKADAEMFANGIVAVGDISNSNHSFYQKAKSKIFYHTFVEVFGIDELIVAENFRIGKSLQDEIKNAKRKTQNSITPHAPYSVSEKLFKMISDDAIKNNSPITIHNQESESENKMFISRSGKLFETLLTFGDFYKDWKATGTSSLVYSLTNLPKENKIQLVHNTFSSAEDIAFATQHSKNLYWCFCPNANLFIENRLPDFDLFVDANCKITIGTDSHASNWRLSILDEMKTISKYTPHISLEKLLQWATINGAEFLRIENQFGSIEKGKKCGLNLIENVDLENMALTESSSVRSLLCY